MNDWYEKLSIIHLARNNNESSIEGSIVTKVYWLTIENYQSRIEP